MTMSVPMDQQPGERPPAGRITAALALYHWYETTHGNEFGHDHHCHARMAGVTKHSPDDACTCGWDAFLDAEALMERT